MRTVCVVRGYSNGRNNILIRRYRKKRSVETSIEQIEVLSLRRV